ncbi:HAD family phosphatase [Kribbella sandramycini]|uniref:2-haloacid dehalogenase n=1 Tax=Kribbella sandramycini TaxID=60450 RepID=A0A7Y4P4P0_9ACTN|nr:HAD family phosphatase [Kribbella sandramycini]MBB6570073.1 2-haloacid dehalogenase [Kribbella sandramycini]NOL45424.1 HAD family phosphatase [Kribbella sandramycini]
MTIDAVVFDIGGVLLDWSPDYLYAGLIPDEQQRTRFLTEVATPAWNQEQDAGRSWAEAVAELSGRFPEHAEWIAAYDTGWLTMVKGVFTDTAELLGDIQALGLPTYALTNFSAEKWEVAKEAFPILSSFDGEVVSGTEQTIKPDEKIYRILLERYALDPARTFYTDDMQYNVDGARAVGIDAEQFTGAADLRAQLKQRGLQLS